jgi:hypothetical protein
VEQGRCFRMACSNVTLLRGLACAEVGSCDGTSRSHRHTEGLWTRPARDDPGVCGIADSNTHRVQARVPAALIASRLGLPPSSSAHRVQAILPAAARGGGGARPGRGQGRRGRWKRPCEFPSMLPLLSSPLGYVFSSILDALWHRATMALAPSWDMSTPHLA